MEMHLSQSSRRRGKAIIEWEQQGWRLNSNNTDGMGGAWNYTVNHYLLFERGQ
jgi:hypothetical protein